MERCWASRIRSSRSRRRSSSMITWWSRTSSRSRCGLTPSSRCRSRWRPNGWFELDCCAASTASRTSAPTAPRSRTVSSSRCCSSRRPRGGTARRSRTATSGTDPWRRSKAASAAKLASTSRSSATWWCWTSSSQFSLLGKHVKVVPRIIDCWLRNFLLSFITFPQILFDGFQAEPANTTNANQSLPSFELVDIFTADVSSTSVPPFLHAFSKFCKLRLSLSTKVGQIPHRALEIRFSKPKILFFFRLLLARFIARNLCGSGKRLSLINMDEKLVAFKWFVNSDGC